MGYCKRCDELFEADSDHTAAAAAAGRYTFICRQDDNAFIPVVPRGYDRFQLNVSVYYKKLENGVLVLRSDQRISVPRELFLDGSELLKIVFGATLYRVDLPQGVEKSILDEVIRLADKMVIDDSNNVVHRQILPMTVEVVISENEEEMSARTLRDSVVDEAFPDHPMNYDRTFFHDRAVCEEVIGGLEKVAHDLCSVKQQCAICLDAILVGNRMPCSHIYHGNCVYRWLRKSNSCPLCRFAILRN